jgi:hypothetical protein
VTEVLQGYLSWPGFKQAFRLTREREVRGEKSVEVVYGITSLGRDQAGAERLLALSRGHWAIENRLFCVRDVTFREDQCRVRQGTGPQVMAATRNVCLTLIRSLDYRCIPEAREIFAEHRQQAVNLVRYGRTK